LDHAAVNTARVEPAPPFGAGTGAARLVGRSVHRREDPRLLAGRGRYVDDVVLPGMLHAHFVRSDVARARITRLDTTAAAGCPGVVAVLTAADLNPAVVGRMHATPTLDFPGAAPARPLADGDVRFVGDPFALVVASSRYVAEDAAELIDVDLEPLPPVVDYETAAADTECLVHAGERPSNVASVIEVPIDAHLQAVFDSAPHVVTETFTQQRYLPVPMETRGIVAAWDRAVRQLRIWVSSQSPHDVRTVASRITGIAEHQVRVSIGDVGGGFGQKAYLARDEQVVILAAHHLGRPVKWIEDRRENLVAGTHARNERITVTLAADADGHILGAHVDHLDDLGAYPLVGGPGAMAAMIFTGPYRIPRFAWRTTSVWTNTCPRAPYRGPWQIETLAREQIVDVLARAIDVDPLELRRRNVLRRDELPHAMPTGVTLEEISPAETLEQAAAIVDYPAFRAEQERARAEGRLLGLGIGLYIEPQTGMTVYGTEPAHIRVQPTGVVDVYLGSGSHGQGLETTTAQLVADHLGADIDRIAVHQGDTEGTPYAFGTGGSRSGPVLGAAVRQAAMAAREKVVAIAAHLLEAAPDDLDVADGVVSVRGTPTRSVTLADVARAAYVTLDALPPGMEPGLEVVSRYRAPGFMFSNACHVCTVEVDAVTGAVSILRYVVSEDCGVMINPAIVEGQIDGGVVQGIGGVLLEEFIYDEAGNPLTTTFLDYLVPTAADVPIVEHGHVETPALTPGGYKGVGEGGAIGAPAAVANAVNDALAHLGVSVFSLPMSPANVGGAIASASSPVGGSGGAS
jgi:aerobic carbon-monoxide dehydrogenase large subunit